MTDDWHELDDDAVGALQRTLAELRGASEPAGIDELGEAVRAKVLSGEPPFHHLAMFSGMNVQDAATRTPVEILLTVATAVVEPSGVLDLPDDVNFDDLAAASTLNHADWLQIVTSGCRRGVGAYLGADDMLDWIEEDIRPDDFELVEHGLGWISEMWRAIGIIDGDDRLTAIGVWVLPRAFARVWGAEFD